jgi:hypothetical protein
MAKKEKNIIETKFLNIKNKFKAGGYDIEEMDHLTCDLIAHLAQLTDNGVTEVEGVSIDLYKNRVWYIVELAGLLPEYRDEEDIIEKEDLDEEDDYYKVEDECVIEIDDSKFYR